MDFFIAELVCPDCGETSPANPSTNMSSHIRGVPESKGLQVGDELGVELTAEHMTDVGYRVVEPPEGDPVTVLETWECPACGRTQWARIVVADGKIGQIEAVRLSRDVLQAAHYLSTEAIDDAVRLTGRSYDELVDEDLVAVLLGALEPG